MDTAQNIKQSADLGWQRRESSKRVRSSQCTVSTRLRMRYVHRGRALPDSDGDAKRLAVTKCPSTVAQEHR